MQLTTAEIGEGRRQGLDRDFASAQFASPAEHAIWFGPGAIPARLPDRERDFDEVHQNLTNGTWPRGKKSRKRKPSAFSEVVFERLREQDAILDEIGYQGFVWHGGEVGGVYCPPVHEIGRRSAVPGAHVVRRIVALTPRSPDSGTTKGAVSKKLRKSAALFDDYIVLNDRVRGVIRIDSDQIFESWEHVLAWLIDRVKTDRIPFLPHGAVARRSEDGKIFKPHFLILLPYGSEVRWDRRFNPARRKLFKAVEAGWIRGLDGDAGGASNSLKVKNPCCPRNIVAIFNQTVFQNLTEMAENLDCRRINDREAAAAAADVDQEVSNEVFNATRVHVWHMVAKMADMGDPRYPLWVADRKRMLEGVMNAVLPAAIDRWRHIGPDKVEKIVCQSAGAWLTLGIRRGLFLLTEA